MKWPLFTSFLALVVTFSSLAFGGGCPTFVRPSPRVGLRVIDPQSLFPGTISSVINRDTVQVQFVSTSAIYNYSSLLFSVSCVRDLVEGSYLYRRADDGSYEYIGQVANIYNNGGVLVQQLTTESYLDSLDGVIATTSCDRKTKICEGQYGYYKSKMGRVVTVLDNGYGLFKPASIFGFLNQRFVPLTQISIQH